MVQDKKRELAAFIEKEYKNVDPVAIKKMSDLENKSKNINERMKNIMKKLQSNKKKLEKLKNKNSGAQTQKPQVRKREK